jgi:hypothetical protein
VKIWFDTEFHDDGTVIDLISIGMVKETGEEYYAVCNQFNPAKVGAWIRRNVLSQLPAREEWKTRETIRREIEEFVGYETPIEFWAYYGAYDWVILSQLFGGMLYIPAHWPKFFHDVKWLCEQKGNPQLPKQGKGEHNALLDARWNKKAWEHLTRT